MARPPSPTSETEHSVLTRLGMAALVSTLCGVLVAGLALPVVASLGLGAKSAADSFMKLPTELDLTPLATRSRVLDKNGGLLATFYALDRIPTAEKDIPSSIKKAVVAIEDNRFYEHDGIDVKGTLRAAVTNAKSGRVAQGGSTLTQQYVKNVLIEAAAGNKEAEKAARAESADRKLREARYALALEKKLTKDEILHGYLEIAYFGNNVYGIGSAASFYFRKPVQKLSVLESAELAGMVQNPNLYNPASTSPAVRTEVLNRRNTVLGRMRDLGFISQAQHDVLTRQPLPTAKPLRVPRNCDAAGVSAPFFCDYVLRELTTTPVGASLGDTPQERTDRLLRGGLTIRTTLDPVVQRASQGSVDDNLPRTDPSGAATASTSIDPATGEIRAMAVDRTFSITKGKGRTAVNYAIGGSSGFQAGSTFKLFTLAAALQAGLPVSTSIYSPQTYTSHVFKNGNDDYQVNNADVHEAGTFDMRKGTADSVNTYFIQLAERVGLEPIYAMAEAFGVRQKDPRTGDRSFNRDSAAGVIGAFEVSPLAMTAAYAAIANHGVYCPPRAVVSITSAAGTVPVPESTCKRVLEAGVADTITDLLRGVITSGTAQRNGQIGRPAAGKTGTAQDSKAVWFIGYTPQLATGVWVGLPNAKGEPQPIKRVRIAGQYYGQMYGGDLPTRIWRQAMKGALSGEPIEQFAKPDLNVVDGKDITVPDTSGVSYEEAVRRLEEVGLAPTRGRRVSSALPDGVVAYTYPAGGDSASFGQTTYVYTSSGRVYTSPPKTFTPATAPPAATTTAPATKPTKPGKPRRPRN